MITKLTKKSIELGINSSEVEFKFNMKKGFSIVVKSKNPKIKKLQTYLTELKNDSQNNKKV